MTLPLSRRTIAKGALWTVPAVAVSSAAPAFALSCNQPTTIQRYSWSANSFSQAGADGYLNTVAFWVTVTETPKPDPLPSCTEWVDNSTTQATVKVDVVRVSGSTSRYRSITLSQADSVTTVTKTHDTGSDSTHPVGGIDYSWTITFAPAAVWNLNGDHRFYVTLHPGDGGIICGRIMDSLVVDGSVADPQF